jgi:chromosome condensin MukBEF complex kleisin-like MukF subunit
MKINTINAIIEYGAYIHAFMKYAVDAEKIRIIDIKIRYSTSFSLYENIIPSATKRRKE